MSYALQQVDRIRRSMPGLISVIAVGASLTAWSPAATASELPGSFKGDAFGVMANAKAGPIFNRVGRVAWIRLGCDGTNGRTRSNEVESLSIGTAGRTFRANVVLSTTFADKTDTGLARVRNTSTVSGLNLFGGMITASSIKAVANISASAENISANSNGSTFQNLRIAGKAINAGVAANSQFALPGIGSVVLKSVRTGTPNSTGARRLTVEMLRVIVSKTNSFGLPIGANITVAHAAVGFTRAELDRLVGGQAYIAKANAAAGDLNNGIGKAALVKIGCEGTSGNTLTNEINALSIGTTLNLGVGKTTAFAGVTRAGIVTKTTASVNNVRVLNRLIQANAVTAVAQDTFANGRRTSSTAGTRVQGLRISGILMGDFTARNVRLRVPGIGYVIVNEVIIPDATTRKPTVVNGLHLFVTLSNKLGLPVGTELVIAHADSTIAGQSLTLAAR
jgi:hypothetical protein